MTSVGDIAMKKIMGQGMINVPNDKKINLIKSNALTNKQINKLKHSPCNCDIQFTNKQMQNGGFLGFLASLGIPLISSFIGSLMGKRLRIDRDSRASGLQFHTWTPVTAPGAGLQIDSSPRTYRRIPIVDFKKVKMSWLSNF